MPRQNRVDPFGRLNATDARGLFFGNRGGSFMRADGSLKDRHWASQQWIICVLSFKGRKHNLDDPNRYTGLFFLDEATALAAGHRPCFECRRAEATAFRASLITAGEIGAEARVQSIDALIAGEVQNALSGAAQRETVSPHDLPDGAFYAVDDAAFLKRRNAALPWSARGYGPPLELHEQGVRLTPRATCAALKAGYKVQIHPTSLRGDRI